MAEKSNLEAGGATSPPSQMALPPLILQQQPLVAPQQPMVIQIRRPPPKRYPKFRGGKARVLGITQIMGGVLAIFLNAVGIGLNDHARDAVETRSYGESDDDGYGSYYWRGSHGYHVSTGFWCSVFFFISGSFAIWACKRPTKCVIITCLVMTIISCVMSVVMLGVSALVVSQDAKRISRGFEYTRHFSGFRNATYSEDKPSIIKYSFNGEHWARVVMPVSPLFLIVSMVEVAATIWCWILCTKVLCCSDLEPEDQYQGVQYQANLGQPQLMVLDRHGRPITGAQVIQVPAAQPGQQMASPTVLQPGETQPCPQSGEYSPPPPYV